MACHAKAALAVRLSRILPNVIFLEFYSECALAPLALNKCDVCDSDVPLHHWPYMPLAHTSKM